MRGADPGGTRPPGINRYIAKADTNWNTASVTASVASHAFTAVPLENPATLTAKNCGSWILPKAPRPTATAAPIRTATRIAMAPPGVAAGAGRVDAP